MVVRDQWLRRAGRPGPTPGVRELEADDQAVVAPDGRDVRADEIGAQRREVVDGRAVEDELARVGAPVVPHGDGFATPDELRSALAEAAPAAAHEVRGSSVGLGVPPFHGQHREPVADGVRAGRAVDEREGSATRGPCGSTASSTPSWSADAEHREPRPELVDRAQALHLDDLVAGHSNESKRCAMSARTARSLSGRRGAPGGVVSDVDPTAKLQEQRSVVSVRGDWCPERERAQVLEEVVELVERPLAVFPAPVALGEGLRRERRQAQQVVGPVTDHVDGEVVAGEHVEVGTHTVADLEAIPLGRP